jgi:outer membrane protein TolC
MDGSELMAAPANQAQGLWVRTTASVPLLLLLMATSSRALEPQTNAPQQEIRWTLLEAVRETLAQDPTIQIQEQQIQVAKGAVQIAAGQFDLTFDTALSAGLTRTPRSVLDMAQLPEFSNNVPVAVEDVFTYRAGLTKQFRSGITVGPAVQLDRFSDNLLQTGAVNRASVSFVVKVPLLRGAGVAAVDAQEQAAQLSYEAAQLDYQQVVAARILNVVSAYWNGRSAQEQLEVARGSRDRAQRLATFVEEWVRIKELTESDLLQAKADLDQKTAEFAAAEQSFWQARQDLAQAVGFPLGKMSNPPIPVSPFPLPPTNGVTPKATPSMLAKSLERRADYLSVLKSQRAAQLLEVAARKNARPQLDLTLQAGYSGLDEGDRFAHYYLSLDPRPVTGPNLMGTLSLSWPFANRSARGLVTQRQAEEHQSQLRGQALARTIHSGVLVALHELDHGREEVQKTEAAVLHYDEAVKQEKVRLGSGAVSILDVITLTDRADGVKLSAAAAHARFAIALARARYETGLLLQPGATPDTPLSLTNLTSLTDLDSAQDSSGSK